ncbi:MAG: hypothetical protein H7Y09_05870 [Chitinophagaceae bacterium]|nr:hypothetical protein [Anaerolineae bacterium]
MTVTAQWDNEAKTIIRLEFVGKWTWAEHHEANTVMEAMVNTASVTIDLIPDLSSSQLVPEGALSQARSIAMRQQIKFGLIVAVKAGKFIEILYGVFQQLYGRRSGFPDTFFVDSLDEARALIHTKRTRPMDEPRNP